MTEKSGIKCKLNTGFITSSDRVYSWRVAPQHCSLPLHPVNKCKALSGLTKKCKFVSGLLTKMCKLFSGRVNKYKLSKEYEDTLNLGVIQTNWFIHKGNKTLVTNLITLSTDGIIFYKEYYENKLNDDFDGWTQEQSHVQIDSSILNRLNMIMLSKYNRNIDIGHIGRNPDRSTFGYACFFTGTMPKDGLRMIELVEENDTKELENWLRSINPIRQVYSYLGLRLLQNRNLIELMSDTKLLMADLENSSTRIYSCEGCTNWEYEPIKELLSQENVTKFIDRRNRTK
jgi:hypothetical protein